MPIITIYKGTFTGGEQIANGVAETLGYRCVSREELVAASLRYGLEQARLTEILDREPHWWERWLETLRPYQVVLQAAMCEIAQGGNLVYHGHIGHELFAGIHHVLKVLLTAPLEVRIKEVQDQQGLEESAARRYIDHLDKARSRRLMALFGTDWRDVTRYDLALNLARMSVEGAKRVIVEAAKLEQFQATTASEQEYFTLALASRVRAALAMAPNFRNLGIGVRAVGGEVRLSGLLPQNISQRELLDLVRGIRGVSKVVPDFVVAHEQIRRGFE